jgi:hypothetical protein
MTRVGRFCSTVGLAVSIWALAFVAGVVFVGCDAGGPTAPDPVAQQPAPVAEAPAPAASPTPKPVAEDPTGAAITLACFGGAQMVATYNGPASFAEVETWDTDFDNQNPQPRPHLQTDLVALGKTVTRTFEACRQGDAAVKGGKESGCFWDIKGSPFIPSREPAKTAECRARCTPVWRELEEVRVIDEEWSDYVPDTQPESVQCVKHQRRYVIHREQNSCTKEIRDLGEKFYETRTVPIECPCVNVPTTRTVDDWGAWSNVAGACGTRTGKRTVYTLNSCTNQETSETSEAKDEKTCPTCEDFVPPTSGITGTPAVDSTGLLRGFSGPGTVAPSGGTFSPDLPELIAHSGTVSTTYSYTKTYKPLEWLQCSTVWKKLFSTTVTFGGCFYNVDAAHGKTKAETCLAINGASWNEQNHLCSVPFPGIHDSDFQLNGGQSDDSCLDKH